MAIRWHHFLFRPIRQAGGMLTRLLFVVRALVLIALDVPGCADQVLPAGHALPLAGLVEAFLMRARIFAGVCESCCCGVHWSRLGKSYIKSDLKFERKWENYFIF